jgi:glycosyltransferase involved in cell wall biosynthesis
MALARPRVSIVVPVYNDARNLADCLAALRAAEIPGSELIVVDDASRDDSVAVARRAGATVIPLEQNAGPAVARNRGAAAASGEIVFFVDADVAVARDAVRRVADDFAADPNLGAVFGSYDDTPRAPGIISQYRNLLHHFVHQQGNPEASTFWAGCGAIRRATFVQVGGFDEGAFGRAIEDIELGYRVRRAGHRILLDKGLLGTHLKVWTFTSLIRTDIMVRAIPWSRLIMAHGRPNDLNLKADQRLSAVLVVLGLGALLLAPFWPILLAPAAGALLAVATLNRTLYGFFLRRRGVRFVAAAIPLHLLYYLYSIASYAWVWFGVRWERLVAGGRA